ncbi:MAG: type II toxin-antitoxin system PemK/MazF family toxin [Flavobacteriaceae bacterium]
MICERWDVVVVPFPFLERPVAKSRPALVQSSARFNEENGHTILAMITTGAGSSWPSDHEIAELKETGLRHRSLVRWKLFTLPNELVSRTIGSLSRADRAAVREMSKAVFAD